MGLFSRGKQEPQPEAAQPAPVPGAEVRNDRVAEALTVWAGLKNGQTFADVVRRAVTGELLLDITDSTFADPAAGPQPGDTLAITSQPDNAGKRLLVAFTSNGELSRYRGHPGMSLVQPAAAVLAQAAREYEGIVIDGRSPGAFIAYSAEIQQQLAGDPEAVGPMGEATATRSLPFEEYLTALAAAPVFVPFEVERDESGAQTGVSVLTVAGADGAPYAVIGTAPAEVWAWSPQSGAQPTSLAHVARAVLEDRQAGVVVNPAGPSVTVPVDVLRRFASGAAPRVP